MLPPCVNYSRFQLCFSTVFDTFVWIFISRLRGYSSVKSLYNFKNLLRRQTKGQISGNYYKMRRIYSSFFFGSFNTPRSTSRKYSITYTIDVLGRPLLPLSNTVPVFTNGTHIEVYYETEKNSNIYVSFSNNFHVTVFSFACVINF